MIEPAVPIYFSKCLDKLDKDTDEFQEKIAKYEKLRHLIKVSMKKMRPIPLNKE